jgi:hypothetical protein
MQTIVRIVLACILLGLLGCSTGLTPLSKASLDGKTSRVVALIEQGHDIEEKLDTGQTPLMVAALGGHNETVAKLIEKGANIESRDIHGRTPLMYAVLGGDIVTIKTIIESGSDINRKDDYERTAHFIGSQTPHFRVVTKVLESEPKINVFPVDFTINDFKEKWNTLNWGNIGEWELPSAENSRPYYRWGFAKWDTILTVGPYKNKVYWASLSLMRYHPLRYVGYGTALYKLIELIDPSLEHGQRGKIAEDLGVFKAGDRFAPTYNFIVVNNIVYSMEISMREGTLMHFTAYHQQ